MFSIPSIIKFQVFTRKIKAPSENSSSYMENSSPNLTNIVSCSNITPPFIFPNSSHFINIGYLFRQKTDIEDLNLNIDL